MKNSEVANTFVDSDAEVKTKHFFIEGNVIYSYGYHFPVCVKLSDGYFLFNKDGYSNTTSRHKSLVSRQLPTDRIILLRTEQLKQAIDKRINSVKEITIEAL
jgi:hypothetical protein